MIDIVLATYNGESYLQEQIRSIQNNSGYEHYIESLIVVDDGSTDATQAIVESLSHCDSKIVWVKNNSGKHGPSNNFSFGLAQTQSQYVMLSDQDDVWLPEKIETSIKRIKQLEAQFGDIPLLVFSDKEIVDETLQLISPSYFALKKIPKDWHLKIKQLSQQNVASGCTMLFNRALLEKAMPIPEQAYMHDWWLALIATRCGKMTLIEQPLMQYRQHSRNAIGANKRSQLDLVRRFTHHLQQFENSFLQTVKQAGAFVLFEKNNQLDETNSIKLLANINKSTKGQKLDLFVKRKVVRSHFFGNIALLIVLLKMKQENNS